MSQIISTYCKSAGRAGSKHPVFAIALIFLISMACSRDRNMPGYEYVPDMARSVAYESYSESSLFDDSKSALLPVPGTIPREMIPYTYENSKEGLKKAGIEHLNPLELSDENIKRGKDQYNIFCASCHNENGDGNGFLFSSEKYAIKPTSLIDEKTKNRPDGEIYHIITLDGAAMGSYASQIKPIDRWKIIQYIRHGLEDNAEQTLTNQ